MTSDLEGFEAPSSIRGKKPCAVYFLQVDHHGPIKIGYTRKNPINRILLHQHASPYEIRWIGYMIGVPIDEIRTHERFAGFRIRGEWFHPAKELVDYIARVCPRFDAATAWDEINRADIRAALSAALGLDNQIHPDQSVVNALTAAGLTPYNGLEDFYSWIGGHIMPWPALIAKARSAVDILHSRMKGLAA
jgi:hypothetical protein